MKLDPQEVIIRYRAAKTERATHENDWRLVAQYGATTDYGMWQSSGVVDQNASSARVARATQFDTSLGRAIPKFVTILHRLLTPEGQFWHGLKSTDAYLNKQRRVRLYFQEVRDKLFALRYSARSNFVTAQSEEYRSLGLYGNAGKFIVKRPPKAGIDPVGGLSYRCIPLRDLLFLQDSNGMIDTVLRTVWANARQAKQLFPEDQLPDVIKLELAKPTPDEGKRFEFIHVVCPNGDYDQTRIDYRRFPFVSFHVATDGPKMVGAPEGFTSNPYITPRTETEPGSTYGFSPAQVVLGGVGALNAQLKTIVKQGQKAVDPVLLAHDDGVMNGINQTPGAINYGGVDAQGRKLVQALDTGNFTVAEKLVQDDREAIKDVFFVNLFNILIETPQMTATEVVERISEKAALLAPMMGRMQSGDIGPMIDRELDIAGHAQWLPEMPGELIDAQGAYSIQYTSPLAKQQTAEGVSGFMRIVQLAVEAAQATGDVSHVDRINFDVAIPEMGDIFSVPVDWLADDKAVEAKRAERSKAQQQQTMVKAAPALASVAGKLMPQQGNGQ